MYVPLYRYEIYVHTFSCFTERTAWIISERSGSTNYMREMFAAHQHQLSYTFLQISVAG